VSQFVFRFHKAILITAAALSLIAIVLSLHLRLDPNFFSLLPTADPGVKAFFEIADEIGFQSRLIAIVERQTHQDVRATEAFVEKFAQRLATSPLIQTVDYKTPEIDWPKLFDRLLAHLPLLLHTQELDNLAHKLSDQAIVKQIQTNRQLLMTPMGIASQELIALDPLGLRDVFDQRPNLGTGQQRSLSASPGIYRTADDRMFFLFITPTEPPQNIAFSKHLMQTVRQLEQPALKAADELQTFSEKLKVYYTGGYPIAISDEATTKKDIQITLLTSFAGVMLLFALAFRTIRMLFYVGLPLVCSLLWTIGFAVIVFGRLNVLTCIFACVLIGLGVDFAIHFINRYFDSHSVSLALQKRLKQTFDEAGMGIIIGGITTAIAFFTISVSDFRGFRELGIVTGTGIVFSIAAMTLFLPALLVFFDSRSQKPRPITIAGFGLKPCMHTLRKYPQRVLILAGILIGGLTIAGLGVKFDDNLRNFRTFDNETLALQERVSVWLGGSIGTILLVNQANTENQALAADARAYQALRGLKQAGQIAGITALSQYLPSPEQQHRNLETIRQQYDRFDIKRIQTTFKRVMHNQGFKVADLYEPYFASLARAFAAQEILLPSTLQAMGLQDLLRAFVLEQGDNSKTVIYIQPAKDLWLRADVRQFKEMIVRKLNDAGLTDGSYILTGANLLTGDLKDLILKNMRSALGLAGISILMVLLLYYRNIAAVLMSLLPLMAGLAALSGLMAVLRIEYNFLNIMILPMIVGIGLDDGVHFTNTYRQTAPSDPTDGLRRTGRAVVLTSLTTLIGFGSITLSHYPGLQSMGYVSVIGITACMIAALIILPALFQLMASRQK